MVFCDCTLTCKSTIHFCKGEKAMLEIEGLTLYGVPEISEKLGITVETTREYFKKGIFKGRKIARRWYCTQEAFQEFLKSTEQG
jgi:hypothetical protein